MGIAYLFTFSFFIQIARYRLVESSATMYRYIWYAYYITIVMAPVLFYYVSLFLNLSSEERPDRRHKFALLPGLIFVITILTNDLHELVFIFFDENGNQK